MKLSFINFASRRFAGGDRSRFLGFAKIVAIVSVALGNFALITALATLHGFEVKLRETAVKFAAHASVQSYRAEPIENYESIISRIESADIGVARIAPNVERKGLIRSKSYVEGIVVRGFKRNYDITNLAGNVVEGTAEFSAPDAKELLIGKRLARKLGVGVGDKVFVYAMKSETAANEMPSVDKFTVTGLYQTGMARYDDVSIFAPYEKARRFFKMGESEATSIEMMLEDPSKLAETSLKIKSELQYPYYVLTVDELHGDIFNWIEFQKEPIPIVLGLISIVAVLNVVTILLITVVEKTRSIGILRSLGMKPGDILKLFAMQGVNTAAIGSAIGCGLGLVASILQNKFEIIKLKGEIYYLDSAPSVTIPSHYVIVILATLFCALLASILPAWVASKTDPVKAIRFK